MPSVVAGFEDQTSTAEISGFRISVRWKGVLSIDFAGGYESLGAASDILRLTS